MDTSSRNTPEHTIITDTAMLPTLTPTDFVSLLNQTLEITLPSVTIEGELANFRVSKNRWVYFDLKDQDASVKFFGTVYNLPGPLEEGMVLRVTGSPRLHPLYGFSITIQTIELAGKGTIKKAFELLLAKLTTEGLFDESRKRPLPYPPERIGLITSSESAAYADFTKILDARWQGVDIKLADVQVQGEAAPRQIVGAIEWFNKQAELPEVLIIIRGGGSADDLQAFSTEVVARAVAASRIPTMVAIGHEIDLSLAELAADVRASTPSNAAELLVPDHKEFIGALHQRMRRIEDRMTDLISRENRSFEQYIVRIEQALSTHLARSKDKLEHSAKLLQLLDPERPLQAGYALVTHNGKLAIRKSLHLKDKLTIKLKDGEVGAEVSEL